MRNKLLKGVLSVSMALSMSMVSTFADDTVNPEEETPVVEETPEEEVEALTEESPEAIAEATDGEEETEEIVYSSEDFLADLEADGYAELDAWKVEAISGKANVYHMDESTKALPGGAYDEDGNMNNPSSIYFVVGDEEVLIVDGGNPMTVGSSKEAAATAIVNAFCGDKDVYMAFTHNHGDHMGLAYNSATLESTNLKGIYVNEADDSSYLGTCIDTLQEQHGCTLTYVGDDNAQSFTVGGRTYDCVDVNAHTAGSMAYVDTTNEIVFTGDSIGSGFVWIFWQEGTNPLGTLYDSITTLQAYVGDMASPKILCGHRWQQFWESNTQRPGEMTIQYLNDMKNVISGLTTGNTIKEDYASYTDGIELSANGCKAKVDTTQELIDEYVDAANSYTAAENVWVFSKSGELSIETVNNTNAAKFMIFTDKALTKAEAKDLIDKMGITDIITESASTAIVIGPQGETWTEDDVTVAMNVMDSKIAVSTNLNIIGIGDGATFVNKYMSQKDWSFAGIMTYGGEAGTTPKYSVPAYVSNSPKEVADAYIAADKATTSTTEGTITTYVNPDCRFEIVAVNSAEEDVYTAFQNAWTNVLSKFGRIGNITIDGVQVGTWYSKLNSIERTFQFFDSVDCINDQFDRTIVTYDFDGDGIDSLYYVYVPETVKNAPKGSVPVVFLMHGNTNDPRTQYDTSGWAQVALEEGIILVCPEWQGHTYQGYTYDPMTNDTNYTAGSDFTLCVKKVLADYDLIDASRCYISGLSAGCRNTTNNCLVNTGLFAAGAGQSGPFVNTDANLALLQAGVDANKDAYDIPIIYFAGDHDEYLTDWDNIESSGGLQNAKLFAEMNEIELSTGNEEYSKLYGIKWDTYTENLENEGLCQIISGTVTNAKGVEICMNRIIGWGHWNYAPDAEIMWEFMSKYSRNQTTGEIEIAKKVEPVTPDAGTTGGSTGGNTSGTVVPNTGIYGTSAALVGIAGLSLVVALKKKREH